MDYFWHFSLLNLCQSPSYKKQWLCLWPLSAQSPLYPSFKSCLLFFPDGHSHLSSVVRTSLVWMVARASPRPGEPTAVASLVSLEGSTCYFSAKELVLWFLHPWDTWTGSNVSSSHISFCHSNNCSKIVNQVLFLEEVGLVWYCSHNQFSQYGVLPTISFASWGFVNCTREPYWVQSFRNDKRRIGAKG